MMVSDLVDEFDAGNPNVVLILVLVDDGLWLITQSLMPMQSWVLILVLVDDGLWQVIM